MSVHGRARARLVQKRRKPKTEVRFRWAGNDRPRTWHNLLLGTSAIGVAIVAAEINGFDLTRGKKIKGAKGHVV